MFRGSPLLEFPQPRRGKQRLKCDKCEQSGRYQKDTLIRENGADIPLPELLRRKAVDCPRMDALGNDPGRIHYLDLI